jgi:hypothetical protein
MLTQERGRAIALGLYNEEKLLFLPVGRSEEYGIMPAI